MVRDSMWRQRHSSVVASIVGAFFARRHLVAAAPACFGLLWRGAVRCHRQCRTPPAWIRLVIPRRCILLVACTSCIACCPHGRTHARTAVADDSRGDWHGAG
jgi:hypothetical protein